MSVQGEVGARPRNAGFLVLFETAFLSTLKNLQAVLASGAKLEKRQQNWTRDRTCRDLAFFQL